MSSGKDPLRWQEDEVMQMKKVHSAYLRSYDAGDELTRMQNRSKGKDAEFFLPPNSCLRSDRSEMSRPASFHNSNDSNMVGPFQSYENFMESLETRFWLPNFLEGHHDPQISDLALKLVTDICMEQSKHDLRDKQSSALGKIMGGNERREHIVPLTLVLHELKLWCVNTLRVSNPSEQAAFVEINRRVKYLVGLVRRDIWANSKMLVMRQGIRSGVYDRLSGLLQRTIQALQMVELRVFRLYSQRKAHEKIGWLLHLARNVLLNSFKFASCLASLDVRLNETMMESFRPTDFLLESIKLHADGVDWSNMVNTLLRGWCLSRNHLTRLAILNDFTSQLHSPPTVDEVKAWGNSFCDKKAAKVGSEPPFLEDAYYRVPSFYEEAYNVVTAELRGASSTVRRWTLSKSYQSSGWKRAFPGAAARGGGNKEAGGAEDDRARAVHALTKVFAGMEDCVLSLFALYELWMCALPVNENCVMECLNPQLLRTAGDAVLKFSTLQGCEAHALRCFTELAAKTLADQGKMSEAAQLLANGPGQARTAGKNVKSSFPRPDPTWVLNLDFIATDVVFVNRNGFLALYRHAQELARETDDYEANFKNEDALMNFGAKESNCVKIVDACQSPVRVGDFTSGFFNMGRVVSTRGLDWLNLGKDLAGAMEDVSVSAFDGETEIVWFRTRLNTNAREIAANLADEANPNGNGALEAELRSVDLNNADNSLLETAKQMAVRRDSMGGFESAYASNASTSTSVSSSNAASTTGAGGKEPGAVEKKKSKSAGGATSNFFKKLF